MAELRRSEPNQSDVQTKLSSVLSATLEEQRRRLQRSTVDSLPSANDDIPTPQLSAADCVDGPTSQLRQAMEVVCKMCDQMLFMMVEWARGARFFRELKVESSVVDYDAVVLAVVSTV